VLFATFYRHRARALDPSRPLPANVIVVRDPDGTIDLESATADATRAFAEAFPGEDLCP
jgi:hypothetical protein